MRGAIPPSSRPSRPSRWRPWPAPGRRSEEHTSELQSPCNLVCRLLLEKKKYFLCLALPHEILRESFTLEMPISFAASVNRVHFSCADEIIESLFYICIHTSYRTIPSDT